MRKANRTEAAASMIAGMGGYGCMAYDVSEANTELVPHAEGRYITAIQAFEDTEIVSIDAAWDAPASVENLTLIAGSCLYVKASKIVVNNGSGILYYGLGEVV